jgi:Na+/phosphate symporter
MKKVCLAGFWAAQYVLGAAAIYAMHEGVPLMSVPFLLASYFATIVGGKVLGIRDEMQRDAHASVPAVVNMLWTLIGFIVVVVFASTIGGSERSEVFRYQSVALRP